MYFLNAGNSFPEFPVSLVVKCLVGVSCNCIKGSVISPSTFNNNCLEGGENNVEAQQDVQNRTGTEPIQQKVTEQHIVQNEEDKGRGEENSELLINYDNIDTVEK